MSDILPFQLRQAQPNPNLVAALEDLLQRAKDGEIQEFAAVRLENGDSRVTYFTQDRFSFGGHVYALAHNLITGELE